MKTITQLMIEAVAAEPEADPDTLADAVLSGLSHDDLRALVRPMFVREASLRLREVTRRSERRAAVAMRTPNLSVAASLDAVRSELAAASFIPEPGEPRVAWLDATPDQHARRARWLRQMAGHCVATADLHERWAKRIRLAGATCMRDLQPEGTPNAA